MPSKRRKLLDTATADVANILVELSQNPTENSTPACSASIDPAPTPCTVKLPSPATLGHQHTQTTKGHDSDIVAVKIKNVILNHEIAKLRQQLAECQETNEGVPGGHFGIHDVKDNDAKCKFYTGLTWDQFMCVWNYLGSAKDKVCYWNQQLKTGEKSPSKRPGVRRKLSPLNEFFLMMVRLRVGLLNTDLAYRFGISPSSVSKIVTSWIQFLYLQFGRMRNKMFASRQLLKHNMPPCFAKFKGIRVIIDCCEFFVEQSTHFRRQGNLYSSYKNHSTFKCLIGISPNGGVMFVSDAFEGSMSDNDIVKKSGFLDKLDAGDLILADRGFTIRDMLYAKQVDLNIPPFLQGRNRLTVGEEITTKQIARVHIYVERAIERIKKFRLLKRVIPLSLQPVFSQMVFVAGCLVNFQDPLVK
ncbi:hypothetical protein NP493_2271g00004 [Ridgeia piscesae]|uniref:DDE Tnp4 domain-containing protein n=1 Tax=Ridgeia piscesae TaxID=27915 RepID=A0AAD9N480_RIDPI|nr:hypothetical protein NP493_2271g00004 [Ridgeia piscesae]